MRSTYIPLHIVRRVADVAIISFAVSVFGHAANAAGQNVGVATFPSSNPKVAGLFYDARDALRADDIRRALLDLKLAVGMEPDNAYVMTELGIAFNQGSSFANA